MSTSAWGIPVAGGLWYLCSFCLLCGACGNTPRETKCLKIYVPSGLGTVEWSCKNILDVESQFVDITLLIKNVIIVINVIWSRLLRQCLVGFGVSPGTETP